MASPAEVAVPLSVALLGRADGAREQLRRSLEDLGAQVVFEGDPAAAAAEQILVVAPQVVIVNLGSGVEDDIEHLQGVFDSPDVNVVFNEGDVTSQLAGWDLARWARHLAAKVMGHERTIPPPPPGSEPLPVRNLMPVPGAPPTPAQWAQERAIEEFMIEAEDRVEGVPSDHLPLARPGAARDARVVPEAAGADVEFSLDMDEVEDALSQVHTPAAVHPAQSEREEPEMVVLEGDAAEFDAGLDLSALDAALQLDARPLEAPKKSDDALLDEVLAGFDLGPVRSTSEARSEQRQDANPFDPVAGEVQTATGDASSVAATRGSASDEFNASAAGLAASTDHSDASPDFDADGFEVSEMSMDDLDGIAFESTPRDSAPPRRATAASDDFDDDFSVPAGAFDADGSFEGDESFEGAESFGLAASANGNGRIDTSLSLDGDEQDFSVGGGSDDLDAEVAALAAQLDALDSSTPARGEVADLTFIDFSDAPAQAPKPAATNAAPAGSAVPAETPAPAAEAKKFSLDSLELAPLDAGLGGKADFVKSNDFDFSRISLSLEPTDEEVAAKAAADEEAARALPPSKPPRPQQPGVPQEQGRAEPQTRATDTEFDLPEPDLRGDAGGDPLDALFAAMDLAPAASARAPSVSASAAGISRVIVLGASIGGPDALRTFLGGIPENFPALFLLVQHLENGFFERLAQQLQKASKLPVRVPDASQPARSGEVLVIPANQHFSVDSNGAMSFEPHREPPKYTPCIDDVMRDIADRFGSAATGIIFSGMAGDAIEGAVYLTTQGGEVWAQDPASCVVSSMVDGARARGVVEFTGSPRELAERCVARYG